MEKRLLDLVGVWGSFTRCAATAVYQVCFWAVLESDQATPRSGEMASRLHQIARAGVLEEGEDFFREATDSRGLKAVNALDGMQR